MDAIFFEYATLKESIFVCHCGWIGSELELDVLTNFDSNMVCCPICHNDDVRVLN